jgi:hypothetical protein
LEQLSDDFKHREVRGEGEIMSFGDGIAGLCRRVEETHGTFAAWCTLVGFFGGTILLGLSIGWVTCEHVEWTVGREYPNQAPCNQAHVCDTFHGFLAYEIHDWWNNDVKKW